MVIRTIVNIIIMRRVQLADADDGLILSLISLFLLLQCNVQREKEGSSRGNEGVTLHSKRV